MVSGTTTPPINLTGVAQRNLVAMPVPPPTLLRIVPGGKWATLMWPHWLKHIASRKVGGTVTAPWLGLKTASHIYVTDEESLDGYLSPGDIASRLGLQASAHFDCNK